MVQKVLNYKTSFRATLGKQQFIAWVRTDATIDLKKDVVSITPDYSEQVKELLLGNIEKIDYDAPVTEFFINGKAKAKKGSSPPFLGYVNTKAPSRADVLLRIWPSLEFANHTKTPS